MTTSEYQRRRTVRMRPRTPTAATTTPLCELVEERRTIWEQSVDELDASVWLEADGVNDVIAAQRFGVRDVADLAERLTILVPARVPFDESNAPATPIPYLRLAGRGLLFAVPGLFYLVVAFAHPGRGASIVMVIAMLAGWGLSQAVALVAYRVLGRAGEPSAALVMRQIMTGAVAVVIAALVVAAPGHQLWPAGLAAGQILYVIAATVLLFHNADQLLAIVLLPGALLSAAYLTGGFVNADVAVAAVAATVLGACAAAWYRAHLGVAVGSPTGRPILSDLWASGPFVLQGMLSGAAVAYIPVHTLDGHPGPQVHSLDLSIVPLVLSMGCAEIELLRLRAAGNLLMRRTVRLRDYQRGAALLVLRSQLRFLAVLAAVSVLVAVVISVITGFNTRDLILLCAYSTLGTALLAALILVAIDRVTIALLGFWLAGCAILIGLLVTWATGLTMSVEGSYLAACLLLLGFLTALAVRAVRDPRVLA